MEHQYKLYRSPFSSEVDYVLLIQDTGISSIPMDVNNMDYRVYLEWVSKGNQPLPAD
jgi:hypothetical protein